MSVIAGVWGRGLLVLGCICSLAPPAGAEVVKPVVRWIGVLKAAKLQKKEPATGIINSQEEFTKLWKVWRGTETVPEVDFETHFILVGTFARNRAYIFHLEVDETKDAGATAATPVDGEPQSIAGFAYTIAVFPREKVKSYGGKLIPAAPK